MNYRLLATFLFSQVIEFSLFYFISSSIGNYIASYDINAFSQFNTSITNGRIRFADIATDSIFSELTVAEQSKGFIANLFGRFHTTKYYVGI